MDEDPRKSEMPQRGRKTALAFEPDDWAALGLAFLALGALVVAVISAKAVSKKAASASTEGAAS